MLESRFIDAGILELNVVWANAGMMIEARKNARKNARIDGDKVYAVVQAFKKHIDGDARVAACDQNPLGVAVSIRSTLSPALAGLEAALAPA